MIRRRKYIKIIASVFLVVSIFFFVWNSFIIFIAGFVRQEETIVITNHNRETIISLMKENLDCFEEIPHINQAKGINHLVLMHKDEINIYYEDGTTYTFYITKRYKNPFIIYIQNEGYNPYFRSSEFVNHLIKAIVPFVISVISITVLMLKKQSNSNRPSGARDAS